LFFRVVDRPQRAILSYAARKFKRDLWAACRRASTRPDRPSISMLSAGLDHSPLALLF
jgi:hypothetical protein